MWPETPRSKNPAAARIIRLLFCSGLPLCNTPIFE
jgi:hypothetical protein